MFTLAQGTMQCHIFIYLYFYIYKRDCRGWLLCIDTVPMPKCPALPPIFQVLWPCDYADCTLLAVYRLSAPRQDCQPLQRISECQDCQPLRRISE